MARIIRTTPTRRKQINLRVVLSFLLIMQIQMPNAHEKDPVKTSDLSFRLTAKTSPQLSHALPAKPLALACKEVKAN